MAAPNDGSAFGKVSELTIKAQWSEPVWSSGNPGAAPDDGSAFGLVSNLRLTARWPYPVWPAVA